MHEKAPQCSVHLLYSHQGSNPMMNDKQILFKRSYDANILMRAVEAKQLTMMDLQFSN